MLIRLRLLRGLLALGLAVGGTAVQAQLVCLPIDRVQIDNADILGPVNTQAITAPYEGRCLGLVEFDEILEAITLAYVDRGFVLSRAYLPEQDLTTRRLVVKVIEGELDTIRINGAAQPRWSGMVFPGLIGKPVNIREVEQGLDQIEAMPRYTAELAFEAGDRPGDSVLEVAATTPKNYEIKLTTNNRGNDQTGEWNTGLSGDVTNVLGLNDTITWNLNNSIGPGPLSFNYTGDQNRSAGFDVTVPYGRWSFTYGYSWSDYQLTIPGAISPIVTDGWSSTQNLSAEYLWDRDQTTKQYLTAELTRARNENFIQDVRVDNSSRILTGLKLGYAINGPFGPGTVDAAFHVEKGLTLFGAERAGDLPAGSPDPQYFLIGFNVDYNQRLGGDGSRVTWSSTASGQLSADRLYGGQAFSIGGVSTVRGSKIALASGSSGVLWRNELTYDVAQAALDDVSLYAALDLGHVFAQPSIDVAAATALGGAIGVKLRDDHFTFDLSYQEILSVSQGLQQPEGQFLAAVEIIF